MKHIFRNGLQLAYNYPLVFLGQSGVSLFSGISKETRNFI